MFYKDISGGLAGEGGREVGGGDASARSRGRTEPVRTSVHVCLWVTGHGQSGTLGSGEASCHALSLGKGHFYLLHVRHLCQLPKTAPQI